MTSLYKDTLYTRDFIRHMSSLFVKRPEREALCVLYNFDLEVSHIITHATNPLMGMIRIQWWREALEKSQNTSPLALDVQQIIEIYHLDLSLFLEILDAREAELEALSLSSLEAVETHIQKTSGHIHHLALQIIAGNDATMPHDLIFHTSCAFALMRPFLYHNQTSEDVSYDPKDVLSSQWHHVFSSEEMVQKITERAEYHINAVKPRLKTLPKHHIPIFLPILAAEFQINALKKNNYYPSPLSFHVKKTLLLCKIGWFMLWF